MALRTTLIIASLPLVGMPLLGGACEVVTTRPNLMHCTYNEGDRYCAQLDPNLPYCTQGMNACALGGWTGCVAEVTAECHAPCGILPEDECVGDGSSGSDSSGGSGSGGSESSDEGSSSSTGPAPCVVDDDCPSAETPFCEPESGECVGCEETADPDGACAGLDPGMPLCVGGGCVACTAEDSTVCDEQLLLCDEQSNACVPCTEHRQCEAGACDVFEGRCFDPNNVLHVGVGQPYASITAAMDDVGAMMLNAAVLVLHEGASFDETVTVDTGAVAFVAADGELPQWVHTGMPVAPTLAVSGMGARVYLHRVRLAQNGNDVGLSVADGARVDARRSRIVNNTGGGILAQNGAELVLRNCFVGGANTDVDAISLDGSTLEMQYTTVGGGTVLAERARALFCQGAAVVDVRNSILVSADMMAEVECAGAMLNSSATESEVGNLNIAWFNGYAVGDFTLTTMGMPSGAETFVDLATWQLGDPTTDIDGDPRPMMDGAPDYAGADVP